MSSTREVLRQVVRPLEAFFRTEALGGTVLIVATVVALACSNSALSDGYAAIWSTPITIGAPSFGLSKALILWVNDLLMAIFFLVVGLEIKRELLVGELSSLRKAGLPVVAAIGGMAVPALLFVLVNRGGPGVRGWGIPMATDIAFALGCLRMLGGRVPAALIVFLTAVAIIDDLGAILVIALAYSAGLSPAALGVAGACVALLVGMNLAGVRRPAFYVLAGVPLWIAILKSGLHATIAGVIVGLCVPARAAFTKQDVVSQAKKLLAYAESEQEDECDAALRGLEKRLEAHESPLTRLEHALHPWVAFAIVPVFALANAGVDLRGMGSSDLLEPVSLGIVVGLVVGKQVGVCGATFLAVRLGVAELPRGVTWRHLYGASLLAGIGFTMSLFIAGLAFGEGSAAHQQAKLAILVASLACAVAGMTALSRRSATPPEPAAEAAPG